MKYEIRNLKGDKTGNIKPGKEDQDSETRNIKLGGSN